MMMDGSRPPVLALGLPFVTAYGDDRLRVIWEPEGDSMTKQSFADEVDVNNIVTRFARTGVLPEGNVGPVQFRDVSEMPSYQEALNHVRAVTEYFGSLPAETRALFDNDPGMFADWVSDPDNAAEAERLNATGKVDTEAGGAAAGSAVASGGEEGAEAPAS